MKIDYHKEGEESKHLMFTLRTNAGTSFAYDKEADALYIYLRRGKVSRSKPEGDDFVVDVDKEGRIVGLEVLNASRYMNRKSGKLEVGVGDKTLSFAN